MRPNADISEAVERHADTVLRVCTLYFGSHPDREDAFQDTFLKYSQSNASFANDEHRKAWLIKVATNTCKDMLKRSESKTVLLDQIDEAAIPNWQSASNDSNGNQADQPTEALHQLDEKYRVVLYLKYYEGYTAADISKMLAIPENTIYTNLSRGREMLKEVLTHVR